MTQKNGGNADFNPKHRIIGAIIVVSLAVIFVPMILGEREPPSRPGPVIEVPKRGETENLADTRVVVVPVEPIKSASSLRRRVPSTTKSIDTAQTESNTQAEKSARPPVNSKALATKTVSARVPKSSARTQGWIVQVGTFASLSNATRLRDKLKTSGYSVDEENITLEGNKAVRLRVGPFQDKPAALRARANIQNDLGVQGVVLSHP